MSPVKFIYLLLSLLASTSLPVTAQVRFTSLEDLFKYADQHAVSIQNAREQELIALSKNKAAKAALLPSINASAGFNDNLTLQPTLVPANLLNPAAPEGAFNEFTFGRQYLYSTGLQASWDVINFQKWFEVKTSETGQNLSDANTRYTRFQTYNQLAQTYYAILLTEQYLSIASGNTAAADSIYRIAQDRYTSGIFSEENRNRAQIQQIQTTQQEASLASSLALLYHQLQTQLNTSESLVLTEQLITPSAFDVTDHTTPHPRLQVQLAQLQLNEQLLAQSRALHYPTLSLGYQMNQNWATDKMTSFSSANNLPQQFWGIKLTIPVFNGLATREKIRQAQIQLQQQQQLTDNQRLTVQKEDEDLQIKYRQYRDEVQQQQAILNLQSDNDRHTQNRYESGIIGLDERLDKFRDLLLVQNQYMQSLSNYYLSYYQRYLRIKL